jgi:hypothetical protein
VIIAEETATSGLVEQEIDLSFLTPAREQTSKRRLSEKDETITQLRKKVKLLQQNVRRRDLKLSKMGDLLDQLKNCLVSCTELVNVVFCECCIVNIQGALTIKLPCFLY